MTTRPSSSVPLLRPAAAVAARASLARPLAIGAVLAAVVWLRAVLTTAGAPPVPAGLAFGVALLCLGVSGGWRPGRASLGRSAALGLAGGAALVAVTALARLAGPALPLHAAAPWLPWAAATVVVASAEEVVVRGVLFDAVALAGGDATALIATALVFALMHVPLYGTPVIALDFGVGLLLGGLRLLSGGPGAPAVAHALADLAAWLL